MKIQPEHSFILPFFKKRKRFGIDIIWTQRSGFIYIGAYAAMKKR
jgi:hypothetical protein